MALRFKHSTLEVRVEKLNHSAMATFSKQTYYSKNSYVKTECSAKHLVDSVQDSTIHLLIKENIKHEKKDHELKTEFEVITTIH